MDAGMFGEERRLRDDVVNGYVSPESAAADYGSAAREALDCPACRGDKGI